MGVTVYAYQIEVDVSEITGYGSSIEEVADELLRVREEIRADDEELLGVSALWAFDLYRPDLEQLYAVLNRDAELANLILKDKRLVRTVAEDEHKVSSRTGRIHRRRRPSLAGL
jgi:hypothetical protein